MTSHRRIEKGYDPHNARFSVSPQWRRHLDQVNVQLSSTQSVLNHTYKSLVMLKVHLHDKYSRRPGIMAWRWEPSTLTRRTGSLARKQRGSKGLGAVLWEPFESARAALGPYSGNLRAGASAGHVTMSLNQKSFRSVCTTYYWVGHSGQPACASAFLASTPSASRLGSPACKHFYLPGCCCSSSTAACTASDNTALA